MTTEDQRPDIETATPLVRRKKQRSTLSLIWVVPVVAVVIALTLIYQHFESLGPLITIEFKSAEGIEANRTAIKRLNVEIGRVTHIDLDESLDRVVVSARMVKGAEAYLNSLSKFWVVRPRIGLSGVTGLNTLLSGSYIEMDSVRGGTPRKHFTGLEEPPLTPEGAPGIRLMLRSEESGAIVAGSPIYHRGIKVGRIESSRLSEDGDYVQTQIFVDAPYHLLINTNTKFWNASGFDVKLGVDGVEINTETLESVLFGGVSFSNPPRLTEQSPVEPGAVFTLYSNKQEAQSEFSGAAGEEYGFVLYFDESVRGLRIGAPVEFLGVQVGRVEDISIEYNPLSQKVEVPVLVFFESQRISGVTGNLNIEQSLSEAVGRGLRARLQSSSLLTGQLIVELAFIPDAAPAGFGEMGAYKVFPTVPSPFSQIASNAAGFLNKLNALPLEELATAATRLLVDANALLREPTAGETGAQGQAALEALEQAPLRKLVDSMTDTFSGLDAIVSSKEAKRLPAELSASLRQLDTTLKTVQQLLKGDATVSPLYYELSTALQELTRTARSMRVLIETLDDKPNALIFGK